MRRRMLFWAPLAVLMFLLFIAIGGLVVRQLWNWLLPPLFGWPQIGFWQALGLLALCRILFGGLGLHGSGRSGYRRRMAERWEHMTPEERERFRQGMRGRWGFAPSTGDIPGPGSAPGGGAPGGSAPGGSGPGGSAAGGDAPGGSAAGGDPRGGGRPLGSE